MWLALNFFWIDSCIAVSLFFREGSGDRVGLLFSNSGFQEEEGQVARMVSLYSGDLLGVLACCA